MCPSVVDCATVSLGVVIKGSGGEQLRVEAGCALGIEVIDNVAVDRASLIAGFNLDVVDV